MNSSTAATDNPVTPIGIRASFRGALPALFAALLATTEVLPLGQAKAQAPAPMPLGGNLEAIADWSSSWVFKDCFKQARTWMTRTATGNEWESNQMPLTDTNGWPQVVPFVAGGVPQILHTMVPLYGPGDYTVRMRGTGRLELIAPNGGERRSIVASGGTTTQSITFNPTLADNILYLEVRESSAADPLRDIEIIAPGQDNKLRAEPFHPEFLSSLAPYRSLRFMDWLHTNDNLLTTWAQRTASEAYTQSLPRGVAHEYLIALANQSGKDAWICVPHMADDEYVRQTARLYRDTLNAGLILYVEYSNETWNPQFTQTAYVQDRGEALGLDTNRWQAGQKFVARRSGEIFAIFAQEFGAAQRNRFVAVLATQAANAGLSVERLVATKDPAVNPSEQQPEALAIAPYFGVNYEPRMGVPTATRVVTQVSASSIAEARGWTREQRAVAVANNLRLICYEGGQHFTGILGAENNNRLTAVLHAANRDPHMENRYEEYLSAMRSEGVELFLHFNHISRWSQWGSWGALEHQRQPESEAPKWRALKNWAARGNFPSATPLSANQPQTITFRLPAKIYYGKDYDLAARSNSKLPISGYEVAGANPDAASIVGGNKLRILRAAPFSIIARQAGDSVWASASRGIAVTPLRLPQRVALSVSGKRQVGQPLQLTVTINSDLTPVLGSSNEDIISIGAVQKNGPRIWRANATLRGAGRVTLTAGQPGDENHTPAKEVKSALIAK